MVLDIDSDSAVGFAREFQTKTVMVYSPVSVDVSPIRRVDLALRFIADGVKEAAFSNPTTVEEYLASHLILAAANDPASPSVKKKHELERIAQASR